MSRIQLFCIALLFGFVGIGFTADLNGKWIGKMQGPDGDMEIAFNFKVSGDTLTGAVQEPMGELPISNGKLGGDTFSFDVSFGDMNMNHQCTVLGDSISMKVPGMQGEEMKLILKRPAEQK